MREMKKATCRYCGLQTDMHVINKRKISGEKTILVYEIRCPRCDKRQWFRCEGDMSEADT